MRYILLLIFALITTYTSAQIQYLGSPTTTVRNRGNFVSDSLFYLPKRSKTPSDTAAIRYQIGDSTVYVWTGGSWRSLGRAGASFLAISDTSSMLANYIRHAGNGLTKSGQALEVDTFTIATRNRAQKQVDSLGGIMVNTTTGQNISGNKIFANDITFNAQVITKLLTLPNKDGLNGYSYIRSKSTGVNLRDIYFPNDSGTVVLDKTIGSYISSNISGTTNYVPKFTASSAIGNSQIFDNGTNVGIGTASPATELHIYSPSSSEVLRLQYNGASPYVSFWNSTSRNGYIQFDGSQGAKYVNESNTSSIFYNNSQEHMRVTSGGNLGVGTSTPDARLDVANTITSDYTSAARFRNSDAGAGNFRNVGIEFWDRYTTVNAAIIGARNTVSGNWQGDLVFKNAQGASPSTDPSTLTEVMRFNGQSKRIQFLPDGTERMRLTSDAELIINTTTDAGAYALQVAGSIYNTTGAVLAASSGNVGIGTANPSAKLDVYSTRTSSTNATAIILSDNVTGTQTDGVYKSIRSQSNVTSSVSEIRFLETDGTNNNTSIAFATQNTAGGLTERMRINQIGNVGIGTASPSNVLHVNGGSGLAVIRVSEAGTTRGFFGGANGMITGYTNEFAIRGESGLILSGAGNAVNAYINSSAGELIIANGNTDAGDYKLQVAGSIYNTAAAVLAASGSNDVRIGSTSGRQISGIAPGMLQVWDNPGNYGGITIQGQNANNAFGNYLQFIKSRGTGNTLIQNGDDLGGLYFAGADGTNYIRAARIGALIDATPGTNDMPTALVFETTADGGTVPSERMRITSAGNIHIGATSDAYTEAGRIVLSINGTSNSLFSMRTNGTSIGFLYANGTTSFDIASNSKPITFNTSAGLTAERIRIHSNGGLKFVGQADPPTAEAGTVYYDTDDNKLKVYNGTTWVDLH